MSINKWCPPKLMPSEYNGHFFSYSMCSLLLMHLGILNGTVKLHFDLSQLVIGHLTVLYPSTHINHTHVAPTEHTTKSITNKIK